MAIQKVVVRSLYGYDGDAVSNESACECKDKSLTVQDQAEEADINTIVKRFGLTGQLPQNVRMPTYGDFTGVGTYQEALNALMQADDAFMRLPADVRSRFDNDAAKFVDFCSDPSNKEEAIKLGLVEVKENGNVVGKVGESAGSAS